MSVATGFIALIIDPATLVGADAVQPCNQCNFGTHLDRDHISGKYLVTYQVVECQLCGKTGIRTRPKVRRAIRTLSP